MPKHEDTLARPAHVIAQGIIANGPLLCLGAVMTSAAFYARGAMPLAYVAGAVIVWLWVNTPLQYTRRLASAGGMFSFVASGTNALLGALSGWSYAIYYAAFAAGGAVYLAVLGQSMLQQFHVATGPGWIWDVLPVLVLLVPSILVYQGVRPSLRFGLAAGLAELVLMLVAAIAIVVLVGHRNTLAVFDPRLAQGGIGGVGVGMLLAAFGMSGSTATVYLGREAHLPHASIRRGLLVSTAVVVVVFLLVSYAMTVGWGPRDMGSFAASNIPGLLVVHRWLGTGVEVVIAVFMVNSIVSAIVASMIVVSRVTSTMAEAGLAPRALARLDDSSRSPRMAVVSGFVVAALGALVASLAVGVTTAFLILILVGTMGEFLGHILGNLALPFFAARGGRVRGVVHVVLPLASLITTALGIYYTFYPIAYPTIYGPVITAAGLALGVGFWASARARYREALPTLIAGTAIEGGDGS